MILETLKIPISFRHLKYLLCTPPIESNGNSVSFTPLVITKRILSPYTEMKILEIYLVEQNMQVFNLKPNINFLTEILIFEI